MWTAGPRRTKRASGGENLASAQLQGHGAPSIQAAQPSAHCQAQKALGLNGHKQIPLKINLRRGALLFTKGYVINI